MSYSFLINNHVHQPAPIILPKKQRLALTGRDYDHALESTIQSLQEPNLRTLDMRNHLFAALRDLNGNVYPFILLPMQQHLTPENVLIKTLVPPQLHMRQHQEVLRTLIPRIYAYHPDGFGEYTSEDVMKPHRAVEFYLFKTLESDWN